MTVSPAIWEEFFLPYNNRLSREYGNLIIYHCCMRYDTHFESLIKTEGFKGLDAGVDHNDFEKIEAALVKTGGVWTRMLGPNDMDLINRLRGKVGLLFHVSGDDREDAICQARKFLDDLAHPVNTRWLSPPVRGWHVSDLQPATDIALAPCVKLSDPLGWQLWTGWSPHATGTGLCNLHEKYGARDGLVYAANRFRVDLTGWWTIHLGNDGPARVFVDGRTVLTESTRVNTAPVRRCAATLELSAGEHEIVVAFDTDEGRGWGFHFAFEVPESDRATMSAPSFPIIT